MIDMEGAGLDEFTCKADDQLCARIIETSLPHKTALALARHFESHPVQSPLVLQTSRYVMILSSVKIRLQS